MKRMLTILDLQDVLVKYKVYRLHAMTFQGSTSVRVYPLSIKTNIVDGYGDDFSSAVSDMVVKLKKEDV